MAARCLAPAERPSAGCWLWFGFSSGIVVVSLCACQIAWNCGPLLRLQQGKAKWQRVKEPSSPSHYRNTQEGPKKRYVNTLAGGGAALGALRDVERHLTSGVGPPSGRRPPAGRPPCAERPSISGRPSGPVPFRIVIRRRRKSEGQFWGFRAECSAMMPPRRGGFILGREPG